MNLFVFIQMCFQSKAFITRGTQIRSWPVIMWMLSVIITISFKDNSYTCTVYLYTFKADMMS